MANYALMIRYINSVDKDIKILEGHPGSKLIVKKFLKMQEYSRNQWAKVHSIVKSMNDETPETAFKKSQEIIELCGRMNMEINKVYDSVVDMCIKKKEKGDEFFLNYVLEEMFYSYSIFLDALHFMGLYYIPSYQFPFLLSDVFANRKMAEMNELMKGDEEAP